VTPSEADVVRGVLEALARGELTVEEADSLLEGQAGVEHARQ